MSTAGEWVFGFGPRDAVTAWRCQVCREVMTKNHRRCVACGYTVYDPVHRVPVEPPAPLPDTFRLDEVEPVDGMPASAAVVLHGYLRVDEVSALIERLRDFVKRASS